MSHNGFQLKGSVLTTFILEFTEYDSSSFRQDLQDKVKATPYFFKQSPVIIDLKKLSSSAETIDYLEIVSICRDNNLRPIGFRHSDNLNLSMIESTNLSIIEHNNRRIENKKVVRQTQLVATKPPRIISKPVRSGQQIYAEACDLVILGSVSGGAEVLADGNIHIYGSLRGRALAGVNGDKKARIFCNHNQAELISIAGHFLLSDDLKHQPDKQTTQFYLLDDVLQVSSL